jgi:predicted dehydrogenase
MGLKVGVVGCGQIALQAHIPAFRELGFQIVGVADENKKTLAKVKGVKHKYTNYLNLLKHDLDFVSICTPPYLHYEMCLNAIERGINVLVEKPLTLSVEEAIDLKIKAEKNKVKVCPVHNYKFIDIIERAKRLQNQGGLGKILSMHTIVHATSPPGWETWRTDESKAGWMLLQWYHPLYLQLWFCGRPKSVYVIGKDFEIYPSIRDVKALINFESSVGFLEMSEFCASPNFRIDLIGTGSTIVLELPVKMRIIAPSIPVRAVEEALYSFSELFKLLHRYIVLNNNPSRGFLGGSHLKLISKFVKSLKSDEEVPVPIDEAIQTIKLAKAIEKSIMEKREVTV